MEVGFLTEQLDDVEHILPSPIMRDDFLDLDSSDFDLPSSTDSRTAAIDSSFLDSNVKMESWDEDVLLSNAGLPEINPLLDMNSGSVDDDFQKMLNEWESHIDSLQTSSISSVDASSNSTDLFPSSSMDSPVHRVNIVTTPRDSVSSPRDVVTQQPVVSTSGSNPRLTIGKRTLAGIVISSGPGSHFETYEGTASSEASTSTMHLACDDEPVPLKNTVPPPRNPKSLLRSNQSSRPAPSTIHAAQSFSPFLVATQDGNNAGLLQTEKENNPKVKVLEASDVDTLLDQFEAKDVSTEISATDDPKRTAQIVEAVHNHFAGSSKFKGKSAPKIVPSQRIKDALPVEIIEKIKASSQKSRTIAIIEPVPTTKASSVPGTPGTLGTAVKVGTRFQEAASALNRNKFRQMGIPSPQQAQVSLDHDYCCPSRPKRGRFSAAAARAAAAAASQQAAAAAPPTPVAQFTTYPAAKKNKNIVTVIERPVLVETVQNPVEIAVAGIFDALDDDDSNSAVVDGRKDSGLESGEVSDASSDSNEKLYSKVPGYLTSVSVENADSRSVSAADESGYDRLPAYLKGVRKSADDTGVMAAEDECPLRKDEFMPVAAAAEEDKCDSRNRSILSSYGRRRRHSSSSSSSCSSSSSKPRLQRYHRRPRPRGATPPRSPAPPPPRSTWSRTRKRPSSRSRSPIVEPRLKKIIGEPRVEKQRQVEERRVVYVGKIAEGTTRADIRKRFEVFGPIEEISVHFRDKGDNYGFVTFVNKSDAVQAIEHGNDDPTQERVDLCFGGRRKFCKEKYSDLDSVMDSDSRNGGSDLDFDSLLRQARKGIRK